MKKRFTSAKMLFLSLFLSTTTNSFSTSINRETAQTVAMNYMQQQTGDKKTISKVVVEEYKGKPSIYAISFEGGGWVLVSTKEEMWPILGFNTTGEYVSRRESNNSNFHGMLDMYGVATEAVDSMLNVTNGNSPLRSANIDTAFIEEADKAKSKWKSLLEPSQLRSYSPGSVLLKDERGENKWSQIRDINGKEIYNNECPIDTKNNCRTIVGCPAIALSQVMWKWKWPEFAEISQGAYLYSDDPKRESYTKPKKYLRGTTSYDGFNWDLIPSSLVKGSTPTNQVKETTRLLRQAGEAIHVYYGCENYSGSGIYSSETYDLYPHAYKEMGYNCYGYLLSEYVTPYLVNVWSDADWNQLIKTEIDAERTVNYCNVGYDYYDESETRGHTYVISGYKADDVYMFYCNLGWGGASDGFYYIYRGRKYFAELCGFEHGAVVGISPKYPSTNGDICLDYQSVNDGETRGLNAKENIIVPCSGKFDVNSGGTLKLRAGKSIKIKSGFSAHSGSTVNAKIVREFAVNHNIAVSLYSVSAGTQGKLEFNVTNANSFILTIRDANGNVVARNSNFIPGNGKVVAWNGNVTNKHVYEISFLNNYGQIDTYKGSFSSSQLTKLSKPTIEDPYNGRNTGYYLYSSLANGEEETFNQEESAALHGHYIYPNPTDGIVYVKVSSSNIRSIVVSNMAGRILMSQDFNSDMAQIDLSSYSKGMYMIQVVTDTDTFVEKLILK